MKIIDSHYILNQGPLSSSVEINLVLKEIKAAIKCISWPEGSKGFYLNPNSKGKGRGEGNGVKPIKEACITYLKGKGWKDELRSRPRGIAGPGPLDAIKETKLGLFAIEWETGNISSSHRALNKICLGVLNKELAGGVLVLPSSNLYPYLTDRIGNYKEITPYLPLWESIPFKQGVILIIVVEQDGLSEKAPRIPKGTDGRALL